MTTEILPADYRLDIVDIELELQAAGLAKVQHAGQMYDKEPPFSGAPRRPFFEEHLERPANRLREQGYGSVAVAGIYLHDIVEDTDMTVERLRDEHEFPDIVVEAVDLVTKRPGQDFWDYLRAIGEHSLATIIKYEDSSGNMANTLLGYPKVAPDKRARRLDRYSATLDYLGPRLLKPTTFGRDPWIHGRPPRGAVQIPHQRQEAA
ncbi:MAG TPA: hypothetical protein VLA92_02215 [Candidatus Saccharimonadales bacterium]|nr:hypothetical protein [Candidatus Saccharimonadales bacterium]